MWPQGGAGRAGADSPATGGAGGGIYSPGSVVTMTGSDDQREFGRRRVGRPAVGRAEGGAIYSQGTILTINRCTFAGRPGPGRYRRRPGAFIRRGGLAFGGAIDSDDRHTDDHGQRLP